jgi:hypothetical protein
MDKGKSIWTPIHYNSRANNSRNTCNSIDASNIMDNGRTPVTGWTNNKRNRMGPSSSRDNSKTIDASNSMDISSSCGLPSTARTPATERRPTIEMLKI